MRYDLPKRDKMTYYEKLIACYNVGDRFTVHEAMAVIKKKYPDVDPLQTNLSRALRQCDKYGIFKIVGRTEEHHSKAIWERRI